MTSTSAPTATVTTTASCEAFVSAPIKLAAKINEHGRRGRASNTQSYQQQQQQPTMFKQCNTLRNSAHSQLRFSNGNATILHQNNRQHKVDSRARLRRVSSRRSGAGQLLVTSLSAAMLLTVCGAVLLIMSLVPISSALVHHHLNSQLINHDDSTSANRDQPESSLLRHHAHYLNFVPSAHFSYNEGRQTNGRSLELADSRPGALVTSGSSESGTDSANVVGAGLVEAPNSHIYKRSSAVLMPPVGTGPAQGASQQQQQQQQQALQARQSQALVGSQLSARPSLNPLSRRMMANGAPPPAQLASGSAATDSSMASANSSNQPARRQPNWLGVGAPAASSVDQDHESSSQPEQHGHNNNNQAQLVPESDQTSEQQEQHGTGTGANYLVTNNNNHQHHQQPGGPNKRKAEQEAELLRQKQHIQYHDQWPSMAGKCHKRTLNFCASVLPFNTTTFPNIIGDTNRFEVKRSLPFFGFLAKSSCNKRLDELLCLLLEPPCSAHSGSAIPPCKKFCRLALEGCNEYIPATLALSSVFDCRKYPDSNDPSVCVNLAQGSKCAPEEFKCPDKTCIPRNWVCDGVRDCIFAADEANCTDSAAVPHASVCSTEEFKCDGKCVPKAWKCDGERDCQDGSDEEGCDLRPKCGPDRFKCADGNGCIPKRWVCDGKAECRDGSDEMNCNQRECSENDFKCDNGICIPKLWRCDRQFDCKDGSDERQCVYPTSSTTTSPAPTAEPATITVAAATMTTTTASPTTRYAAELLQVNASSSHGVESQLSDVEASEMIGAEPGAPSSGSGGGKLLEHEKQQQLEMSLGGDVSRIIQHERDSAQQQQQATTTSTSATTGTALVSSSTEPQPSSETLDDQQVSATTRQEQSDSSPPALAQQQQQLVRELKKFDYDLIPPAANMVQMNELPVGGAGQSLTVSELQKQTAAKQQQPVITQIDFVPQQQQQQPHTPIGEQEMIYQNQPIAQANQIAQQQQQQQRGQLANNFGPNPGPVQAAHPEQEPTDASMGSNRHPQQQQQPAQQRVPIYRSLFKSFKGHHHFAGQAHHRLQLDRNGSPRNVVAIARRRRDRHQQQTPLEGARAVAGQQQQFGEKQDSAGGQIGNDNAAGAIMLQQQQQQHTGPISMKLPFHRPRQYPNHNQQQQQQQQLHQVQQLNNQTRASVQSQASGELGGSVSSYLQLLNGRYNLRLPRVGANSNSNQPAPAIPLSPSWS